MKLPIIYIIVSIVILTSGCNKYLDKNPDPTKRVPTTLEDIDMLVNYARNNSEKSYDGGADEFFIPQFPAYFNEDNRLFYQTWNINGVTPWTVFYELIDIQYRSIQYANANLELLSKQQVTDANKKMVDKIRGKCHYIRASNYLYLAWAYCKAYDPQTAMNELGMPIDEDSYFGNTIHRSTLKDLYAYIIKEAELAYQLLDVSYSSAGELTKVYAMGLLTRIHLSMRNYDQAFKCSNELLQYKSDLMDYNDPDEVNIGSATVFKNHNREMIEILPSGYREQNDPVLGQNVGHYYIDTNLIASYSLNDLRLLAYFKKAGNYYKKGGTFYGYEADYYANHIMMVDEFYLTRAECYARKKDKDNALKDLNDLLVTRFITGTYVDYTAATSEEALNIILAERKKSLVLRGLRWMDIKRLNLEGRNISVVRKVDGLVYTLPPNDPRFARPLHSILVGDYGYEQNPY